MTMKDLPKNMFGVSPHIKRITEVELNRIAPNPDQPRKSFSDDSLEELATTIKEFGLLQPILLRKGRELHHRRRRTTMEGVSASGLDFNGRYYRR
jgi:ParB-like nuclease family protein